jgi:alanyl-tRNA synthetase
MYVMTSAELRSGFLRFFEERGHRVVESSKVVPQDDPTLLFTNAGMNQFKNYFLGTEKAPYNRAASVQKCIRASGKHNDLEDVGKDGRHHTFFEMLGNWSFGDYYKDEAIRWGWEYVTEKLRLPAERLWASVYKDDEEAYSVWKDVIGLPPDRIVRLGDIEQGDEENFWSMGDTGPCGPCSEIHYDYRPEKGRAFTEGSDSGIIVELWNLVFMEFNRESDGSLVQLPAKNVDTGMGLERTAAVLQDVHSDYETDLFIPIIRNMEQIAGVSLNEKNHVSFQVIADHIRCLVFAITDGAIPSNEGRGYVIRRILRRAVRHGRLLGLSKPFLYRLADSVIDLMKDTYSELGERRDTVEKVIGNEEELFFRTLDRGLEEFERTVSRLTKQKSSVFPGSDAFKLHDTFGFPLDLTGVMAEERGMSVDLKGFDEAMAVQRERAKSNARFQAGLEESEGQWEVFREQAETEFTGYGELQLAGMRLLKYRSDGKNVLLVFDKTPFYGESGGQVGDTGTVEGDGIRIRINDVKKSGLYLIHHGIMEEGDIADIAFTGRVERERRERIMANHSATHLLHHALREVLGTGAAQAGSLVAPERLRFDFNHYHPLSKEELDRIEELVNEAIRSNYEVNVYSDIPMEKAKDMGAIMLFDEKYGDAVRVVAINDISRELCGGTHVQRTGDIGFFKILRESSIASGVRRIEAVSHVDAYRLQKKYEAMLNEAADLVNAEKEALVDRIRSLQDEISTLRKKLKQERRKGVGEVFNPERDMVRAGSFKLASLRVTDSSPEEMRELSDSIRSRNRDVVIVLCAVQDGKVSVVLAAADDAVAKGVHAGRLLQQGLSSLGGKGGGRPHLAQGGGIKEQQIESFVKGIIAELEKL